jgi:hypothetical protein
MVKNALHLVIIDRANLARVLFVVRHFISSFTYASGALGAGKAHFCDAQRLSDSGQESRKTVRDCVVPIYRRENGRRGKVSTSHSSSRFCGTVRTR